MAVLRGSFSAKIDDKGRLKVPTGFRASIAEVYGTELFVTSLSGESVRIYPMPVWLDIERKLASMPTSLPARQDFLDRVNYFGQETSFDGQGRVLIQPVLREATLMAGDVAVMGNQTFLEVWNNDRFVQRIRGPLSNEVLKTLAEYGI